MTKLKIAVIVHGRFHGFDLARELLGRGHDVTLFTNYPGYVAERFGIPKPRTRSYLAHGIGSRALWRVFPGGLEGRLEKVANRIFGRWAARQVMREAWDVVIAFSGVGEETFEALKGSPTLRVLQRGSAHIRVQQELLSEEQRRCQCWIQKPSQWIVEREEREYELSDVIHVLSDFAYQSFLDQGVSPRKLFTLHLGVNTTVFRASPAIIEERCRRLLAGEPLRVLNVGAFSLQKGMKDYIEAIRILKDTPIRFRFVGPLSPDAAPLQECARQWAEFIPKRPQNELPAEYRWGDVFVLPTIQDGFAAVLQQALAAGLPLLTSTNCAGPELIREGETGWVVPIRSPEALVQRLQWCQEHRAELAKIVRNVYQSHECIDWQETGRQAEQNIFAGLANKRGGAADAPSQGCFENSPLMESYAARR